MHVRTWLVLTSSNVSLCVLVRPVAKGRGEVTRALQGFSTRNISVKFQGIRVPYQYLFSVERKKAAWIPHTQGALARLPFSEIAQSHAA